MTNPGIPAEEWETLRRALPAILKVLRKTDWSAKQISFTLDGTFALRQYEGLRPYKAAIAKWIAEERPK